MELLLLRHGIAANQNDVRSADMGRPLTKEGIDKMRVASKGMKQIIDQLDLILSSPVLRARETAEIVASEFTKAAPVVECSELALGGSAKRALDLLEHYARKKRVMLVGHEPELVELFSVLTGARSESIEIKKGALVCLSVLELSPRPRGMLLWQLTSKQLRSIAGRG